MGVMEDLLPNYTFFNWVRGPVGTGFDRFAPSNIFPCRDGWVIIAAPTDGPFRKLARCMGKPEAEGRRAVVNVPIVGRIPML